MFKFVNSRRDDLSKITRGVSDLRVDGHAQNMLKILRQHHPQINPQPQPNTSSNNPDSNNNNKNESSTDKGELGEYQLQWYLRRKLRHRVKEIVRSQNPNSYYKHVELFMLALVAERL